MERNIHQMLKDRKKPRAVYHQCAGLDVMKAILSQPKRQPESNLKESFEEENVHKLQFVAGDIIIRNEN